MWRQICNLRAGRAAMLSAALLAALLLCPAAVAEPAWHAPVREVAPERLAIGTAVLPLFSSPDWTQPQPDITRVIIVVHGIDRAAATIMRGAEAARAAAGADGAHTLLLAPQFLVPADIRSYNLPANTLRWGTDRWNAGYPALAPTPLSSFAVLDAILARLTDPRLLPHLADVVVAGHSAGGQMVQRYAVVAAASPALAARHIPLRYVVANPSSYLYFSDDRPEPVNAATCPDFDHWRYGLADAPPYVGATAGLEARYGGRAVTYLLGTADTNPDHPALDKSCAGEAEGPYRLARGEAFFRYLLARHPGMTAQRVVLVPGVGHSSVHMFGSPCGLAVLFRHGVCPSWTP